jgi:hypothetical protein
LCFVFLGKIIPFTVCGHQNPGAIQIARVYPSLYKVDFFIKDKKKKPEGLERRKRKKEFVVFRDAK